MRTFLQVFCVLGLLTEAALASDEIAHLKFDDAIASKVIDFAGGEAVSVNGPIKLVPGYFGGGALSGAQFSANGVSTPLSAPVDGDLSIGLFVKNHYANCSALVSVFASANGGAFSLHTGGEVEGGVMLSGWGGQDLTVHFGTDLAATSGWNHIGVVVDGGQDLVTWYFNGTAVASSPIAQDASLVDDGSGLRVGAGFDPDSRNRFDIDEFRMVARAVTPEEMLQWATAHPAADAAFGADAEHSLLPAGAAPILGSAKYRLELHGPPSSPAVLAIGLARIPPVAVGGAPGSSWEVAPILTTPLSLGPDGIASLETPIPAEPSLDQITFYLQAALADPTGGGSATNPIAIALGF